MGDQITHRPRVDLGSRGRSFFQAIIAGKGELTNRQNRNWLEVFIGLRPGFVFEEVVTGVFNDIGHGHGGVWVIEGRTQSGNLFLDQPVIFVRFSFSLSRLDQLSGEQREDGLKDLFARGLRSQNPPRLFHLTALLATPVARSCHQVSLYLFPGDAFPITSKLIEGHPELLDDHIDGEPTFISETQGLGLHTVRQAERK